MIDCSFSFANHSLSNLFPSGSQIKNFNYFWVDSMIEVDPEIQASG